MKLVALLFTIIVSTALMHCCSMQAASAQSYDGLYRLSKIIYTTSGEIPIPNYRIFTIQMKTRPAKHILNQKSSYPVYRLSKIIDSTIGEIPNPNDEIYTIQHAADDSMNEDDNDTLYRISTIFIPIPNDGIYIIHKYPANTIMNQCDNDGLYHLSKIFDPIKIDGIYNIQMYPANAIVNQYDIGIKVGNSMGGSAKITPRRNHGSEDEVSIGSLMSTMAFFPQLNHIEEAISDLLRSATTIKLEDDVLTIKGTKGSIQATRQGYSGSVSTTVGDHVGILSVVLLLIFFYIRWRLALSNK